MDLDGDGGDDTESAPAAATESPEQVGVLGLGGSNEAAVGEDDIDAEDLVGTETILAAQGRVATTSKVTTGNTNTGALTTDSGDTEAVGGRIELTNLDTGTELEGRAIVGRAAERLDILDVLEVVGPDREGTGASRLTKEVVTRVMDDKTEVLVAGKVDGKLNLIDAVDLHRVGGEAAHLAGAGLAVLGHARLALVEGGHDRGGITRVKSRLSPVGKHILALGSIVDAAIGVADGTDGDSLDEGATGQEVEDGPAQTGWPGTVTGEHLAVADLEAP